MPTPYAALPLAAQLVHVLAAFLLLIAFAMLAQRRILALIHLFAWQGLVLTLSTATVAAVSGHYHLYYSAILTMLLKVWILPHILHRLIVRRQYSGLGANVIEWACSGPANSATTGSASTSGPTTPIYTATTRNKASATSGPLI